MRDLGKEAIKDLTNHQKAQLLSGASFWTTQEIPHTIPSITMTDGPNGLRKQVASFDHMGISDSLPATCFPSACLAACSFAPELIEAQGAAIGAECRAEEVDVLLAPAVNIKRHPLGGRNFEYYSEDPLLSGKMGAAYVRGLQATGVGACVKHLAGNSQEMRRMTSDSVIDEATLQDIYLRPFRIIVDESQPWAIMPAYNRLNGATCSQNAELLDLPRTEWGFDGAYISDWGGMSQSVASVVAGLDLCMPGPRPDHIRAVVKAHEQGGLSPEALDARAATVAALACRVQEASQILAPPCDHAEHLAWAQVIAESSMVLLQNNGVLPLASQQDIKIAVIGALAKEHRYQGSGSSKVNPLAADSPWEALVEASLNVLYAPGYDYLTGATTDALIAEAVAAARDAHVVLAFVGLPDAHESEGRDRRSYDLPAGMNQLMEAVFSATRGRIPVVGVISGGGPVALPWRNRAAALVASYLSGSRGGHALVNILTGKVNPSGHLAESWPDSLEDTALGAAFPVTDRAIHYVEGPFVGYRYYHDAGVPVAYPFGHGLSYTQFSYADPQITITDEAVHLTLTLTNMSNQDGAEVVQAYLVTEAPTTPRSCFALAAFKRVHVLAGASARVTLTIEPEALSFWHAQAHQRQIEAGTYELAVGASSEDIRARVSFSLVPGQLLGGFTVAEREEPSAEIRKALNAYYQPQPHGFGQLSFRALYGKPFPAEPPVKPFTPDSALEDMRETRLGRVLLAIIERYGQKATETDAESHRMLDESFGELPLRSMVLGKVPYEVVEAFAGSLNGHPLALIRAAYGILSYDPYQDKRDKGKR